MKMLMAFATMVLTLIAFTPAHGAMSGGQYALQEYTYDFAKHGGAVGFIDIAGAMKLPAGAIIDGGSYMVVSPLTSGGSATVAIGNASTANQFANALAYGSYNTNVPALISGAPKYVSVANDGKVGITVATAALTGGKIKVMLKVHKPKQ